MSIQSLAVVAPCYNEGENVEELYRRLVSVLDAVVPPVNWSLRFIDNASTDDTASRIRAMCKQDSRVQLIVNVRNFGHIRSPYHGFLSTDADAVVYMASDLQDPPEMLMDFIKQWRNGWKVVMAVKPDTAEKWPLSVVRRYYYAYLNKVSEVPLVNNATGFGLYDARLRDAMRNISDPYPYFRGLVCELGYPVKTIPFTQPRRERGLSKNNAYTLYDIGMLGLVKHSKLPLRVMVWLGFAVATFSILTAMIYLLLKLIFWHSFSLGFAPLLIGLFFLGGVQLFMMGLLGEYVGAILTQVRGLPHVVEAERVNC
jgi:glycosyltransferase involved in cell wall biosynthesis